MGARVLVIDDSPTLRKVVSAILAKYGYEPLAACDGLEALQTLGAERVDLILLDFVMPRMNGYQFCRELRAHPDHGQLPVVLMSAKAERIRDQFLQQTGAVDAITKPFDARGLIAVVEGALQRASEGRTPKAPEPGQMLAEEALHADASPPSSGADGRLTLSARGRSDLVQALSQLFGPSLCGAYPQAQLEPGRLEQALQSALTQDVLGQLLTRMRWLTLVPNTQDVLYGAIASIPVGEILQVLQMQRQTGTLEVTNGKMEVCITLRDGLVDLAQSPKNTPEFLLGRYFIELGLLSQVQLLDALEQTSPSKAMLGDVLVQKGLVTASDVRSALIRQTSELIYEVLRWHQGWFVLCRDVRSAAAESAQLGLPVASIVMEGFRRVDEWRLIEESIDFDEVLIRNEVAISALASDQLTRPEWTVLNAVDGQHTVREIIDETHQASFDTCKTFYRLLQSRLIRRRASA